MFPIHPRRCAERHASERRAAGSKTYLTVERTRPDRIKIALYHRLRIPCTSESAIDYGVLINFYGGYYEASARRRGCENT